MQIDNETARDRLADIRELEPTSNAELRDRWGLDSTKNVARYIEDELGEHTYRDDDARIRADPADAGSGGDTPDTTNTGAPDENTDPPADEDTIEIPEEEFDGVISEVKEEAREAGREEGYTAAQTKTHPEQEETTDDRTESTSATAAASDCPQCGGGLIDGDALESDLHRKAQNDENAARFLTANDGADPAYACRNLRSCGYYVENGEAKTFTDPSSGRGVAGWVIIALGTVAAVVYAVLGMENDDPNGGGDDAGVELL